MVCGVTRKAWIIVLFPWIEVGTMCGMICFMLDKYKVVCTVCGLKSLSFFARRLGWWCAASGELGVSFFFLSLRERQKTLCALQRQ